MPGPTSRPSSRSKPAPRKPAAHGAARLARTGEVPPEGAGLDFDLASFLPHKLSLLSRLTQTLLASTLSQSGMTVAQWRVYLCLNTIGPSHLNGISEFTRLPQSSLSRSIAQLAERGLVRNARNEEDRRIARIELTEEGRKHLAELTTQIKASCDTVFQMDTEEEAAFLHTIDELVTRLEERVHQLE